MKKINLILIIVLIIIASIYSFVYLKNKSLNTTNNTPTSNQTNTVDNSETQTNKNTKTIADEMPPLNKNTDPQLIDSKELGLIISPLVSAPQIELGAFNVLFYPGAWEGSGEYRGTFEKILNIKFTSLKTEFIPASEWAYENAGGYNYKDGNFYLISPGDTQEILIPEKIVLGETELSNGKALLISGLPLDENDLSMFPDKGQTAAILNIPNGLEKGGVFIAESIVTLDEFKEVLRSIVLVK